MSFYRNKLISKNGIAIISLSREIFTLDVGDRIKTVEQYSEELKLGRGTIHSALRFLQKEKAITLESRGHLGTFISFIDYKKLWSIGDVGTIIGVMPLPYSKRYEGLATGLYKNFEAANLPFGLAFMRGATQRIEALYSERYNFAVVSKLAASLEIEKSNDIEILYEFPENSYVGRHVVVFGDKNQKEITSKMRVGIDPYSLDQIVLTNYECEGKDVEFVEISYNQIFNNFKNNVIDAAIWNGDELLEKGENYGIAPLSNEKSINISKEDTIAVIVVMKNNNIIKEILSKFIDGKEVSKIQKQVIDDKITPMY